MIIISLMLWIIDIDKDVLVNKEIINDNIEINYPYFNDNKIDNFINEYLDRYRDKNGIIDYDYDNNDNKYCVVFYKYFFDSNIYSYDLDSFMIDLDSSTISMVYTEVFNYDIITNKKINNSDKLIALTFDDGPNYNTGKVLDVLAKYNVKATFFVLGSKAKDNKKILKRAYDSGMEIGNHTFNHIRGFEYLSKNYLANTDKANEYLHTDLFRPPHGHMRWMQYHVLRSKYRIIMWDLVTRDYSKRLTGPQVLAKVKKYVCTSSSLWVKQCLMLFYDQRITKWYHEEYSKDSTTKCDQCNLYKTWHIAYL